MNNRIISFLVSNEEYLKDLITRSTYHSNAIEGNTLTYAETYAILYNDNSFKINLKEPRELYEAINHKKALEFMFDKLSIDDSFNDKLLKNINEIINKDIKNTIGYRKVQVMIKGAEHIPPEPEKIPNLMNYFIYNYNNDNEELFTKIARYHIEFEKIHPFEDGNGRTGRLLINYELIKNNNALAIITKEERAKYYELLRNSNIGKLADWLKELSKSELQRMKQFGYNN